MWEDQLWTEMERIRKNVNRFLGKSDFPKKNETANYRYAQAELEEDENGYSIAVEIPGVNKEDIELQIINDNQIMIKAQKKYELERKNETKEGTYQYSSLKRYAGFYRTSDIPEDTDQESIGSEYKNGVLHITIPKRKDAKKKKLIRVK